MLQPLADVTAGSQKLGRQDVLVRCVLARIRLLEDRDVPGATALLRGVPAREFLELHGEDVRAEVTLWRGWCELLRDDADRFGAAALHLRLALVDGMRLNDPETILWAYVGMARHLSTAGAVTAANWFALRARRLQRAVQSEMVTPWLASISTGSDGVASVPADFVWTDTAADEAFQVAQLHLATGLPLYVWGESGTGREYFARCVHTLASDNENDFIVLRSGETVSDLVGEWAGGTQAGLRRTICVHDVDKHPLGIQRRIATALLDSTRDDDFLRMILTSTRDFDALVQSGRVDPALLQACACLQVNLPPLRKRPSDIPLLVRRFLRTLPRQQSLPAAVTDGAMILLKRYPWPGNVRQLRNEVERALVHVQSEPAPVIDPSALSASIRIGAGDLRSSSEEGELDRILAETEREIIASVLDQTGGQVAASADVLGLSRQGLYKKMKRLGLDVASFQRQPASRFNRRREGATHV